MPRSRRSTLTWDGVKTRRKTMATSSVRCTCTCRGVHCAGSSHNLRRASTGSGILVASAFNPCRYCRGCNTWLRFSPCGAHRLQVMTLVASCERHVHSATIDVNASIASTNAAVENLPETLDASIASTNAAIEKFAAKAESAVRKRRRRTSVNMRLNFLTL